MLKEASLSATLPVGNDIAHSLLVKPTHHAYLRFRQRHIGFSEVVGLVQKAMRDLLGMMLQNTRVLGVIVSEHLPHLFIPFEIKPIPDGSGRWRMFILTAYRTSQEKGPRPGEKKVVVEGRILDTEGIGSTIDSLFVDELGIEEMPEIILV